MSKIEATGKVNESGVLTISNRKFFDMALKGLSGKEVTITIARKMKRRSNRQNAYWWGIVVPLVFKGLVDAGYNEVRCAEDAHEILKGIFNKKTFVDKSTGDISHYGGSTTELSTTEFMDLIANVQQWAAEALSVYIPDATE